MKFVLIRTDVGKLYVLTRGKWKDMQEMGKTYPQYLSEVLAEANEWMPLMQMKELTQEA